MNFVLPDFITENSTIGIILPGSACSRDDYDRGVEYLRDRGFLVVEPARAKRGRFYLAAPDWIRAQTVQEFLVDDQINAIICARGGYGTLRILDLLDYEAISRHPKTIIGYSDITALSLALYARLGWVSYSGPMVCSEMGKGLDPYTEEWLWKMVMPHEYPLRLENPADMPIKVLRHGEAEGPMVGGCLSLITALLGTPYEPDFEGAILFIEDTGEKGHRLDRHLTQLRLAGVFDKISALMIGVFTNCFPRNPKRGFSLEELLSDIVGKFDFPIITNLAYGHIPKRLTLPIGSVLQLKTDPLELLIVG